MSYTQVIVALGKKI